MTMTLVGCSDSAANNGNAIPPPRNDSSELYRVTFERATVGTYQRADLEAEWRGVRWAQGLERVEVVPPDADSEGSFLRVHYPIGQIGPEEGGAQWRVDLPGSFEELYVAYRVRFGNGFDFVHGGKLPGLLGGEGNTGGNPPTGRDGWSALMMWRGCGAWPFWCPIEANATQYVYHPDQPGVYGEHFHWNSGGQRSFDDQWHVVEHRIVMNQPGAWDGLIQAWWDGEIALDRGGIRFRDVGTFGIEGFLFSTFFGGADLSWAPRRNEHVDFDEFVFSTTPISH